MLALIKILAAFTNKLLILRLLSYVAYKGLRDPPLIWELLPTESPKVTVPEVALMDKDC
jgi:hypothetical protein